MQGQNLTSGHIPKQLWSLAWPMMLSMFFHSLYNLVDAFWVAKISASAIAAVSISQIVLFVMISLAMGVSVGTSVLVGQNIGAGNHDRVREVLSISIRYGSGSAFIFSLLAFIFAPFIVGIFTTDPKVADYALQYFRIVPLGYVFFAVAFIEANIFQGIGRSWPGFWITFIRIGISLAITFISIRVFSFEISSVWLSIVIGSVISSLFGLAWVRRALASAKPCEAPPSYVLEGEEVLPPPIG